MRKIEAGVRPFTAWNTVKQSNRIIYASECIKRDVIDADIRNNELIADKLSFPVRRTPIADVIVAS